MKRDVRFGFRRGHRNREQNDGKKSSQSSAGPSYPGSSLKIGRGDAAVVFIDPQNEVLSENGVAWPLVHESLRENNTIENMERIFRGAKARGLEVFISPHYFYPTRDGNSMGHWKPTRQRPGCSRAEEC
jgi:hypothetical protein